MANQLKIDEQNIFSKKKNITKKRSIPFEEYFGEMELDEEEKETRIALAKSLEQAFLFFFVMIGIEETLGNNLDKEYYYGMLQRKYESALASNGINLDEHPKISKYSSEMCKSIVDATVNDENKVSDPYLLSDDRATFIAENESNSIRNIIVLDQAIKDGYTKKRWITILDKKTRHTHMLVSGEEIGIYDNFHVGECEMVAPKVFAEGSDEDAKEVVNCRCSLRFTHKKSSAKYINNGFREYGDFLRERLGSACDNNISEMWSIINDVESKGGKVILTDSIDMVTNIEKGKPATIRIDKKASIGAFRHEHRHFTDDLKNGCKGLAFYLKNPEKYFEYELNGYKEELAIAEKYGYTDIIEQINQEIEARRKEIFGIE